MQTAGREPAVCSKQKEKRMSLLYTNGGRAAKRQSSEKAHSRPCLVGTARKPGWPEQARAFRAHLRALHSQAPADKSGSEHAGLEMIDNVDLLDAKARYLQRFALAELIKLTRR
jgi:hypothetical protein